MKPLSGSGIHNWLGSLLLVVVIGVVAWLSGCGGRPPVASEPETARRLVTEGLERARQGDYRGATERYDRAIRADPANAEAYAHGGFARMALGDVPGVQPDAPEAVASIVFIVPARRLALRLAEEMLTVHHRLNWELR